MSAVAALLLMGTQSVAAQNDNDKEETRTYPYAFVGIQGGAQAVLNGYAIKDVVTPIGAVNAGAWFSPALGARVHVNGWKSKVGIKDIGTYKFSYGAASVDAMINLTNAFSKTDDHFFNVILLGGLGANKAYGHKYETLVNGENIYYWTGTTPTSPVSKTELASRVHNHVAFQTRVGIMFDLNVAEHLSVNLEANFNHIGSRGYAYTFNNAKGWQGMALFGLTYKFGGKKHKPAPTPAPEPAPVVEQKPEPKPEVKPEPKPEPKPVVEKKKEKTEVKIYYAIAKSQPEGAEAQKVDEIGKWMQQHPTSTATIKGYADKNTGNAEINERYARERAEGIAKTLTEKYGIDASRLSVSSYGDTVQLEKKNDDNRLVIVLAEEK